MVLIITIIMYCLLLFIIIIILCVCTCAIIIIIVLLMQTGSSNAAWRNRTGGCLKKSWCVCVRGDTEFWPVP